jgi:hypothetical protein
MIFIILFISSLAMAQHGKLVNEVGLLFTNSDDFGLSYKIGTEKSLWRVNLLEISGQGYENDIERILQDNNYNQDAKVKGFGINLGKEFRKAVLTNVMFSYGIDLSYSDLYANSSYSESSSLERSQKINISRSGLGLVFGFNYIVRNKIVLGASIIPGIGYYYGKLAMTYGETNRLNKISSFNYNLSNSSANFTVAYRF